MKSKRISSCGKVSRAYSFARVSTAFEDTGRIEAQKRKTLTHRRTELVNMQDRLLNAYLCRDGGGRRVQCQVGGAASGGGIGRASTGRGCLRSGQRRPGPPGVRFQPKPCEHLARFKLFGQTRDPELREFEPYLGRRNSLPDKKKALRRNRRRAFFER